MSGMFTELRRRNVIKVGIAYLVAAWVVAQIVAVVNEPLHLPAWFDTAVIVLLIVGFPFALIVAWSFERTPEGLKRASKAQPEKKSLPVTLAQPAASPVADEGRPSIAVLPFVDMSPEKDQEYFSDGIAEELLNQLAKVKGLHVAGRTSSFHFKGHTGDIAEIAAKLKVAHVLEGSVRKAGNRVRITAQLINAADGYHLWSETYDRELDDIFAIQDEIASAVTDALSITLGVGDFGVSTRNVEAYELFLEGRALYSRSSRENYLAAIAALEKATTLDPDFLEAWAQLANVAYSSAAAWASEREAELRRLFERAAKRASAIAPKAPDALRVMAMLETDRRHWVRAGALSESALEAAPSDGMVLASHYQFLFLVGRIRDGLEIVRQWARVEPLPVAPTAMVGVSYEHAGELERAEQAFQRINELEGDPHAWDGPRLALALTQGDREAIRDRMERLLEHGLPQTGHDDLTTAMYECLDDPPAALAALRRLQKDPHYRNSLMYSVMATWASYFGDPELALEFLAELETWATLILFTMWRPLHREMRQLPEFKDLLRKMGLVDYWRETGNWGDYVRPVGEDDFECI